MTKKHCLARTVATLLALPALLLLCLPGHAASSNARTTSEVFVISGASGQLGELTVKELLARGVPAKNLILVSRTPDKLAEYARLGASTRFGDVDQPESLPAAYAGGTRMLMISLGFGPGAAPRPPRHKIAFDAAVKAGVKRIVYTSYTGADRGGSPLADDHMQSERFLMASGAQWMALRNANYADGQLQAALRMAGTGQASLRPNESKAAPILRAECATVAAAALLASAATENRAYEITGPELSDTRDVARWVTELTGRSIEFVAAAPRAGGPAPVAATAVVSNDYRKLTGRKPTAVRVFLRQHRAELRTAAASKP